MMKRATDHSLLKSTRSLALAAMMYLNLPYGVAQNASMPQASTGDAKLQFFDVASIKLNNTGSTQMDVDIDRNVYRARNVSIKALVAEAYAVRQDLIFGVTGLVGSAHFDIDAKVVEPDLEVLGKMSDKEQGAMLLPMLQERFKLNAHKETKTLPVFELVVVKGGPKFKKSPPGDTKEKGTRIQRRELEAGDITMETMAQTIANQVHRTVIDKTGLTGNYDLSLKWSRDDGAALDDGTKNAAPPIYTALEEQLGLKLVPAKGPVETVVVDHVEMPSEN